MKQKGFAPILIIILIALAVGGYFIYKNQQKPASVPQQIIQPSKANSSPTDVEDIANWKTYTLKKVNLQFQLPKELSNLDNLDETTALGQKGTKLNIGFKQTTTFIMGGTSPDYEMGRGATFTDLQGFIKQNNKYLAKHPLNGTSDITKYIDPSYKNPNNVEMIKIIGDSPSVPGYEMGYPLFGSLGKGWMGAIINTGNSTYPGLSVQIEISGSITEKVFDQILSTFRFD